MYYKGKVVPVHITPRSCRTKRSALTKHGIHSTIAGQSNGTPFLIRNSKYCWTALGSHYFSTPSCSDDL